MSAFTDRSNVTYIAFLLGINIGPHKRIAMGDLRTMCEHMGFADVRTVLASGNVVFDTEDHPPTTLAGELEAQLRNTFGFEVGVIIRTRADIEKMIAADPFRAVSVTKNTRLYATFYTEDPEEEITTPYRASNKEGGTFHILAVSDNVVYSVAELGTSGTTEAMIILGRLFGKRITTRNWNTIKKLVQ